MTYKIYDPYAIRTHYLSLRRRPLYPSELMDQKNSFTKILLFTPPSRRNFVAYQELCRNFVAYQELQSNSCASGSGNFVFHPSTFFTFLLSIYGILASSLLRLRHRGRF